MSDINSIILDARHLLPIFVRDTRSTRYIGRSMIFHQNIIITVPFKEYCLFVEDIVSLGLDILESPLSLYSKIYKSKELLYYQYHKDIADANIFAITQSMLAGGLQCSIVVPQFDDDDIVNSVDIEFNSIESLSCKIFSLASKSEHQYSLQYIKNVKRFDFNELNKFKGRDACYKAFYIGLCYYTIFFNRKDFTVKFLEYKEV